MGIRSFFVFFVIGVAAVGASGQIVLGDIWTPVVQSELRTSAVEQQRLPREFRAYRLNQAELEVVLNRAPMEFRGGAEEVIELPMPDGRFERFNIEHSPVAEPGLYTLYPELAATYRGRGIDDPTATVRFDLMPTGFHAMIRRAGDTVVIDPYGDRASNEYITYYKKDAERTPFECEVEETVDSLVKARGFESREFLTASAPEVISGTQLRTYRLALAGNWEYCNVAGSNTVAGCLAAMTTVMNRVNGVYERDVALRMIMVATNNLIVYTGDSTNCAGGPCTSANDPYSNGSGALSQNTPNLNTVIGVANYDIGHVFTTGSGGVANLAVPCGSNKGGGTTGLGSPFGDPFAIDYVAHEMGHQWGANHTFNGSSGSCSGGNRSASNSYEPGSGITIMAYAGICGGQDLAANSIDTFHVRSIEAIVAYSQTGNGNNCPVTTASGNTPPTVTGPGDFNIPKQTPFYLTATASDPDNDTLTYDWQQYNTGGSTGTSSIPNTDADGVPRPIFRPFTPTTNPTRTFPALQHILNSNNIPPSTTGAFLTGELLPAITRTLTFQVIVRDNRANTGAVNTARVDLSVDGNSGPFAVTSPNTAVTYGASSQQTVTWDVANTSSAPVNAANVEISLSTDGGVTFPHVLAASTANDGSETVALPNVNTSIARIKVQAVGNIFFDVSNANFTITSGATPTPTSTPTATPTNTPTATPTSTPTATPTPSNGFEGDVSPRPNGDNVLNASDVIQLRRFGTGLDTPDPGSEFARADCAPLGTGGDGIVNSADVIQGRRFATGLDPMTNARPFSGGGEMSSLFEGIFAYFGKREIGLGEAVPMGGRMAFPIELRGTGDEAAVSFTLEYDASRLGRPQISLGDGVAAGAILTVNANEPGRIGLLLDSSAAIAKAGRSRIVMITFETAGIDLPHIPVSITSSLAAQNISDAKGNSLAARYSASRSRL